MVFCRQVINYIGLQNPRNSSPVNFPVRNIPSRRITSGVPVSQSLPSMCQRVESMRGVDKAVVVSERRVLRTTFFNGSESVLGTTVRTGVAVGSDQIKYAICKLHVHPMRLATSTVQ